MITIVDYGVGNLFSLESSFKAIGEDVRVSGDADEIFKADKLILPGVGAFGDAAEKLAINGLKQAVLAAAARGTPLMGICLGMQLLLEKGYEYGEHDGLGLIKGSVRPIADVIDPALKIPQIGWNALIFTKPSKLFKYIRQGDHVYFVHSFHAADCEEYVTSKTEYSALLTASVERDNVYGCQFHPEKSGKVGLNILRAFCEEG